MSTVASIFFLRIRYAVCVCIFALFGVVEAIGGGWEKEFFSPQNAEDEWDQARFDNLTPGQKYNISSGSGFFVSNNYIITNQHVVENCANIAIRGAVSPERVKLIASNAQLDLAILYSEELSRNRVALRSNYILAVNDPVYTVGYPLEHAETGDYVVKAASVIDTQVDGASHFTEVEFTDSVEHGNSGGPIMDASQNIVGVVTSKRIYQDQYGNEFTRSAGVGVDALVWFLQQHHIPYYSMPSYPPARQGDIANNISSTANTYVVNIHCVHP